MLLYIQYNTTLCFIQYNLKVAIQHNTTLSVMQYNLYVAVQYNTTLKLGFLIAYLNFTTFLKSNFIF